MTRMVICCLRGGCDVRLALSFDSVCFLKMRPTGKEKLK